jgi:hypothetical protein
MRVSRQRHRELTAEATRLLRADRRKRVAAERAPAPKPRPLPPAWPDHLRLQDLGWALQQLRRRSRPRRSPGDFK